MALTMHISEPSGDQRQVNILCYHVSTSLKLLLQCPIGQALVGEMKEDRQLLLCRDMLCVIEASEPLKYHKKPLEDVLV